MKRKNHDPVHISDGLPLARILRNRIGANHYQEIRR